MWRQKQWLVPGTLWQRSEYQTQWLNQTVWWAKSVDQCGNQPSVLLVVHFLLFWCIHISTGDSPASSIFSKVYFSKCAQHLLSFCLQSLQVFFVWTTNAGSGFQDMLCPTFGFLIKKGWPTFFDLATHLIYTTHHSLEYASPLLYVANGHWGHCGHCGHTGQCLCRIRSDEIDCVWESYCSLHSYYFMSSGALFLRGNTHGDNLEKSISNKLSHRLKWPEMKEDKWMIMVWLCFWLSDDAGSQCWGLKPQSPKLAVSAAHCAVLCWLECYPQQKNVYIKIALVLAWQGMVWYSLELYGMVWFGTVWHAIVFCGVVLFSML